MSAPKLEEPVGALELEVKGPTTSSMLSGEHPSSASLNDLESGR